MTAKPHRWLVSPGFDLGWFVIPGALALVLAFGIGLALEPAEDNNLALWIIGVVLVDVAHVWASLYRTYLDREARHHHAQLLRWTPALVFMLGFMAHAVSPRLFWGALAYVAVFHFIKQQEGFVAIYLRAGDDSGSGSAHDRTLAKLAVWASTAGPVIWWHTQLPRRFTWFIADDFIAGLPTIIGTIAVWAQLPILLTFFARRAWLATRSGGHGHGHPMVPILVALTALSWNLGIVWFNDGRVFTITNVFIHGLPYLALVWVAGGRELVARRLPSAAKLGLTVAVFYALLVVLALAEETAWDRLVWHEHPSLFGHGLLTLDELGLTICVALLSVPQATHYVLDRYIWRVGPSNPRLAGQLGL